MLAYIFEYHNEFDRPPTVRDIQEALNIASTSMVSYGLDRLEENGYITRVPRLARTVKPTQRGRRKLIEYYSQL